ncbi:MAG: molybdopterin-binding protein, partial [Cypionkella sp.]
GGGARGASRRLPDDLPELERAASAVLQLAEVVVVCGGASVGERDFARVMFEPAGLQLEFAKVAIKPGKPVWLGRARGRLVLGLPGNPTSAMVTARLFLAPLLAGLGGRSARLAWETVTLAAPLPASGARETFSRARRTASGAEPLAEQDSGAQQALAEADLLLRRAAGAPASEAGQTVQALAF